MGYIEVKHNGDNGDNATIITVGVSAERVSEIFAVLKQFHITVTALEAGVFSATQRLGVNDDAQRLDDILLGKYYPTKWRARREWLSDGNAYRLCMD